MTGNDRYDVSVITSTFNRSAVLPRAIEALLGQDARGTRYEVIIVDNNSTDATQHVVRSFIKGGHRNLRLVFEGRPGASHGRNTGIQAALAPLLAFTDDDVWVDRGWVASIKREFDEHAEIDYVTGKVLAGWEAPSPPWLTSDTWGGPCVIRDRGDERIYSRAGCFFPGWATANLAFRRQVFDRIGLFSPEFSRGEDLEFILRVWRAGGRGMYSPDVKVTHSVSPERMTKTYHRRWHIAEGEIRARLRFKEIFDHDGRVLDGERRAGLMLFGAPGYVHRELLRECRLWVVSAMMLRPSRSFRHECHVRQLVSYIRARREAAASHRRGLQSSELAASAIANVQKSTSRLFR